MIRYHTIDLLRHAGPIATKTSLDVNEREAHFGAHYGTGQRRIGVPIEQDPVRCFRGENRFQPLQHFTGLRTMAAGTDSQVVVRTY